MLSRGAVRSLLDRLRPPPRGWKQNPSTAMPPPPCLCRFSHSVAHSERRAMLPGKVGFLDLAGGRRLAPTGALSLKGCLGWQDGGGGGGGFRKRADGEAAGIKAQVLTRQRQLMRDPEVLPLEEAASSAKTLNGNSACRRGKPLGFPEQAVAAKMVVAVDVDEVLGSFLAALNKFIADRYSWNHTVSEYHVYEFFRIWNCSRERDLGRMQLRVIHWSGLRSTIQAYLSRSILGIISLWRASQDQNRRFADLLELRF
ncbi:unnamed protein product [Urochloa humidicola]